MNSNDKEKKSVTHEESGTSALTDDRRAARSSKRAVSRSSMLRRKKPVENAQPQSQLSEPETGGGTGSQSALKGRAKPGAKSSSGRRSAKSVSKKETSKTKGALKTGSSAFKRDGMASASAKPTKMATTRRPKAVTTDDGLYEIKSLPDGTQLKVKITDKKKKASRSVPRRKVVDDYGPGPAVVELDTKSSSPESGPRIIDLGSIISLTRRAVTFLTRKLHVKPKVAVILGSGLGEVADLLPADTIPFSKIPGFDSPGSAGHPGRLRAGEVGGMPALICEGRRHFYETGSMKETVFPVQTFLSMGIEHLIVTTSAGALNPAYRQGDIMFVSDHLNMMGDNPLFGVDPNSNPSPFVDVSEIYDDAVISQSERISRRVRVKMRIGTLAGVRGPVYETAAERKWLRQMGADAVCMSVVPEALAAAHVGVPVTALALIVNDVASGKNERLSHGLVVERGRKHSASMKKLIKALLTTL